MSTPRFLQLAPGAGGAVDPVSAGYDACRQRSLDLYTNAVTR